MIAIIINFKKKELNIAQLCPILDAVHVFH